MLTHDILGNLTRVNHYNGATLIATATMRYDLGGRKKEMNDPDLGAWSYAYDRLGKLKRQTDARNNTTCLYYDNVGRLAGKHFRTDTWCPDSVTTYDIRYSYDGRHGTVYTDTLTGQKVIERSRGQLTQVHYHKIDGYYKNLYYNAQGQLAREQVRIPSMSAVDTWYGYDSYLRPTTTTYPDSEQVTTTYNSIANR